MNIEEVVIDAARSHANAESPRESCGVVIVRKGKQLYVPCRNISANGTDTFVLHPEDYASAEDQGEVVRIVHSHPYTSPEPSDADKICCENGTIPWLIVNTPVGHYVEYVPTGYQVPLVGRKFVHGIIDCYTLVRDYYARECGIHLPNFARNDDWWNHGQSLYSDNFHAAGFDIATDAPRKHDAFLMQIRSPVVNHAAVYLGDDLIMHHMYGRLSSRDIYGGYWQTATILHLRHRSFIA